MLAFKCYQLLGSPWMTDIFYPRDAYSWNQWDIIIHVPQLAIPLDGANTRFSSLIRGPCTRMACDEGTPILFGLVLPSHSTERLPLVDPSVPPPPASWGPSSTWTTECMTMRIPCLGTYSYILGADWLNGKASLEIVITSPRVGYNWASFLDSN